ncbi:MAG: FkbM family methyltransferase [Gammaproteobacteria bacterium]
MFRLIQSLRQGMRGAPGERARRTVRTRIGARVFDLTSDDDYLDHIEGVFAPSMVALLSALVRPQDVVLDVGANIGCTALLVGQLAARTIAFEPAPSTFALLRHNLRAAGMDQVQAVNLGLGRNEQRSELTYSANNRSGGFVSDQVTVSAGHAVEPIHLVAGDAWLAQAGIEQVDFIKIDVEGFERHVIEGLAATLARGRPLVVLELNHWCLNAFQRTSVPDFFDFLRGVFPHLLAIDGPDDVRDLHRPDDSYRVMYHHIVHNFCYPNLVGGFDRARLDNVLGNLA